MLKYWVEYTSRQAGDKFYYEAKFQTELLRERLIAYERSSNMSRPTLAKEMGAAYGTLRKFLSGEVGGLCACVYPAMRYLKTYDDEYEKSLISKANQDLAKLPAGRKFKKDSDPMLLLQWLKLPTTNAVPIPTDADQLAKEVSMSNPPATTDTGVDSLTTNQIVGQKRSFINEENDEEADGNSNKKVAT
jgi:hypothetical protein